MSAPLSAPIDTCRYLSLPVDLEDEDEDEDEDEMTLYRQHRLRLLPRRLSVETKCMATKELLKNKFCRQVRLRGV